MRRFIFLFTLLLFFFSAGLESWNISAEPAGKQAVKVVILNFTNLTGDENYAWIEGSLPRAVYESVLENQKKSGPELSFIQFTYYDNPAIEVKGESSVRKSIAHTTGSDYVVSGVFALNKKNKKISIHMELYSVAGDTVTAKIDMDSPVDTTLFRISDSIADKIITGVKLNGGNDTGIKTTGKVLKEDEVDTSNALSRFGDGALCLEGDCKNGFGKIRFPGGEEYTGEFRNGFISGKGVMTWPDGDRYEGSYDSDARNGYGVFTYRNGDIYSGNFRNNIKTGSGEYKWKNGDVYSGEWKDGRMNGRGTYTWSDGVSYTGEWKDGMRNGDGVITWPDSHLLEGTFINNVLLEKK